MLNAVKTGQPGKGKVEFLMILILEKHPKTSIFIALKKTIYEKSSFLLTDSFFVYNEG